MDTGKSATVARRAGGRVKLRGEKIPLTGSVTGEKGQTIRFELPPERWVDVPWEVFTMLKAKFDREFEREELDHDANADHPHKAGEDPIMRTVSYTPYIIEFRE